MSTNARRLLADALPNIVYALFLVWCYYLGYKINSDYGFAWGCLLVLSHVWLVILVLFTDKRRKQQEAAALDLQIEKATREVEAAARAFDEPDVRTND